MLTAEQKWMNRLERCLKDMPEDCELFVNLESYSHSKFHLLKKGENSYDEDLWKLVIKESSRVAKPFTVADVISNSESI